MTKDEAMRRLRAHEAELRALGVRSLFLFGSIARGDAREKSDVDLFFDHERGKLGLFEVMEVGDRAAQILGRRADVMTRNSLHPRLKTSIEASALRVF